jgi:hypothetical protein
MREHSDNFHRYGAEEVAQIACNLLTEYNKLQKAIAIQNMPEPVLQSMQKISLDNEDYEFCQVVKETLDERLIRGHSSSSSGSKT